MYSIQATFVNDVKSLAVVEEMYSPYLDESEDLLVLDTRDIMFLILFGKQCEEC